MRVGNMKCNKRRAYVEQYVGADVIVYFNVRGESELFYERLVAPLRPVGSSTEAIVLPGLNDEWHVILHTG